jgi:Cof subfamily protein (haloacid dehalogenase superfamily)
VNLRCIALDLDRTTLGADGRLSAGNRAALECAIRRGIHIVIASGRPLCSLPADVTAIPGIEYAITSNGAAVYHLPTGKRLHGFTLPAAAAEEILHLTADEPLTYEAFVDGIAYGGADYVADPVAYGTPPTSVAYIQRTRRPVPDITAFIHAHSHELDSLDLVVRSAEDKERLSAHLRGAVSGLYITSSVPQLVEISHADAGKHSGLRFITDLLGISPAQTAAFGDGDNDADLLTFAGCGIAVSNASPACLAAADRITGHYAEDGVAQAIHQLLAEISE